MASLDRPTVVIYAAGSLRNVLPALVSVFSETTGIRIETRHGPAGLLRERIEHGDRPDLFMSANLGHPSRLAELGLCSPPIVFARNTMSAVARRDAGITTDNFVERLLAGDVKIGTSTPINDPSGDYAWEVFRRIDRIRPGTFAILEAKAQKLVGASETPNAIGAYNPVTQALANGSADIFLGYVTGLKSLAAELDDAELVEIPGSVNVVPEYGLATMRDCKAEALTFALFVMSSPGQALLRMFGFVPVAMPQDG